MAGAPIGNQNAKKAKRWQEALARALARYSGESIDKGLDLVADGVVKDAIEKGDKDARREIGDRFDGKPAQSHTVAGDEEGGPIQHSVALEFVGSERSPEAEDSVPGEA